MFAKVPSLINSEIINVTFLLCSHSVLCGNVLQICKSLSSSEKSNPAYKGYVKEEGKRQEQDWEQASIFWLCNFENEIIARNFDFHSHETFLGCIKFVFGTVFNWNWNFAFSEFLVKIKCYFSDSSLHHSLLFWCLLSHHLLRK